MMAAEDDMNENHATRGPNWGLLLLIPAAVIVAKGAMRRRAMWDAAWATEPGLAGHGHGHRGPFASGRGPTNQPAAFRLPPRIEWMLDSWHTRAHRASDTSEPVEATDPADSDKPTTA
jgi:hypothetical protein